MNIKINRETSHFFMLWTYFRVVQHKVLFPRFLWGLAAKSADRTECLNFQELKRKTASKLALKQ